MTRSRYLSATVFASAAAAAVFVSGLGAQQSPLGPYTSAQAAAGRSAYDSNCAVCHAGDLRGSNDAPSLAGSEFASGWRNRTTRDLLGYIQSAMPPTTPGALGETVYRDITAYIGPVDNPPKGGHYRIMKIAVAFRL